MTTETRSAAPVDTEWTRPSTGDGRALPRVRYRTVEVEGLRIFFREAGDPANRTLLLLHGFPSSSHMFRDLIPALADRFHLVAPDYPGFGNSDAPPPEEFVYTFDHLAEVMESFLIAIGVARFSLYVQDYGGPIGFRIATKHPDWIEVLIVQNANAFFEAPQPRERSIVHDVVGAGCAAHEQLGCRASRDLDESDSPVPVHPHVEYRAVSPDLTKLRQQRGKF